MIEFLGYLGSAVLVIASLPQVIKCYRDGHAHGLSAITVWLWTIGMFLLLMYVSLTSLDLALLLNYLVNFIFASIMLKYKYFPRYRKS